LIIDEEKYHYKFGIQRSEEPHNGKKSLKILGNEL